MHAFARSIVDTARYPLLVLDSGLRVATANPPYYRTFAATPTDLLDRGLYELGGLWADDRLRGLVEGVADTGEPLEDYAAAHDLPRTGRRQLVVSARRVTRDDDGSSMVLVSIEDETDVRQAWDELQRLNAGLEDRVAARTAELVAANRELESFCFAVSHDLRAPLRGIDGFSQELLEAYGDLLDDTGRHYLTRVRAAAQRMGQLIDDLLRLSRAARGELRRERVDLTAVAEDIAAELRQREPGRRLTFAATPGLTALCDLRLVRVALENLLTNAWKFTSRKPEGAVAFGRTADGFFVRDDGAGFDMRYADKLFGAFQRLHPDREFPGTGIGLATVQRIVHRHGGTVWAEGAPDRGATFYFTLPSTDTGP